MIARHRRPSKRILPPAQYRNGGLPLPLPTESVAQFCDVVWIPAYAGMTFYLSKPIANNYRHPGVMAEPCFAGTAGIQICGCIGVADSVQQAPEAGSHQKIPFGKGEGGG